VLIAEYDPVRRDTLAVALAALGWAVTGVSNGFSALNKIRGDAFDAVIVGHNLPEIGTADLVREINVILESEPVPVLLASEMTLQSAAHIGSGGESLAPGPFDPARFTDAVLATATLRSPLTA
jgi:DNA-binding response OmpR family regulator